MLALTRASVGIGVLDCFVGDSDPALRRVVEEPVSVQNMSAEVHLAMARAPRIRAVLAFLADNFRANADALVGNRLT